MIKIDNNDYITGMKKGDIMDKTALDNAILKVKDFPKPGILFYDITGILLQPTVFAQVIDEYEERYRNSGIAAIVAIDSRGFIFASPVAYKLQLPLLLVRKAGKLPRKTQRKSFSLEYGADEVELHPEDVPHGKVVLFDDLLATGGTARAACELLEANGAQVEEVASIIALDFLPFEEALANRKWHALISYSSETY